MGYLTDLKGKSSNSAQARSSQRLRDDCLMSQVFLSKVRCLAVGHLHRSVHPLYHELTEPWLPCPLFLSQFINFLVWWLANSIYWKHSSQHFLFSQDFCSFNFQNYLPGFSLTISLVSNCLNNSKYNSDIHFQKNGEKMSFDLPC